MYPCSWSSITKKKSKNNSSLLLSPHKLQRKSTRLGPKQKTYIKIFMKIVKLVIKINFLFITDGSYVCQWAHTGSPFMSHTVTMGRCIKRRIDALPRLGDMILNRHDDMLLCRRSEWFRSVVTPVTLSGCDADRLDWRKIRISAWRSWGPVPNTVQCSVDTVYCCQRS